jgi:hypothetical protein
MTASPIASVRVFDPRCRCRLATFAALPTPSMIEPIIMLTDHPLLAPHRQVRRCHRSIHCWHGHAARRSALPRERFSPVAQSGRSRTCPLPAAERTCHFDGLRSPCDPEADSAARAIAAHCPISIRGLPIMVEFEAQQSAQLWRRDSLDLAGMTPATAHD